MSLRHDAASRPLKSSSRGVDCDQALARAHAPSTETSRQPLALTSTVNRSPFGYTKRSSYTEPSSLGQAVTRLAGSRGRRFRSPITFKDRVLLEGIVTEVGPWVPPAGCHSTVSDDGFPNTIGMGVWAGRVTRTAPATPKTTPIRRAMPATGTGKTWLPSSRPSTSACWGSYPRPRINAIRNSNIKPKASGEIAPARLLFTQSEPALSRASYRRPTTR